MMKIYYEDNHLLVIEKQPNQPVQEDVSGDLDLVTRLKGYLKEKYQKPGNVYVGLVHRLDRPVGGVMVFAKTSKAASRLSEQVRTQHFQKKYTAVVSGKAECATYRDHLVKNAKTNTSFVADQHHPKAKYAELTITRAAYDPRYDLSRIEIELKTGRSHQIRVQCASRNHPIWGDARYNPHHEKGQQIALWASQLTFAHPITKKSMTFTSHTPSAFPFTLW